MLAAKYSSRASDDDYAGTISVMQSNRVSSIFAQTRFSQDIESARIVMDHALKKAAATWDLLADKPAERRSRFWHSPTLLGLLHKRFRERTGCATASEFICRYSNRNHFGTALAIGCGRAGEELLLLRDQLVDRLILSDISEGQLALARADALRLGLDLSRIEFRGYIDMSNPLGEKVDLVYWRDSLHHMIDTEKAVAWSCDVLQGDGVMYCHDACPPNWMQWSSETLDWVERFRASLPARCLATDNPTWFHPVRPLPKSVEWWKDIDPTECADSENIIPSLKRFAPDSNILFRGGMIYGYAMDDIIDTFDEVSDRHLFEMAIVIDDLMSSLGHNYYFTSLSNFTK